MSETGKPEPAHGPMPWRPLGGSVVDRDGRGIACLDGPEEWRRANAILITRAVNCHDDLLLAAKEAAVLIVEIAKAAAETTGINFDPQSGTCLPRLMAAIAKAETP